MLKRALRICPIILVMLCFTCSDDENVDPPSYVLPYEPGESFLVLQGNGGSFSHVDKFYYAFDFDMEIGTLVTASREGTVELVEESFIDANREPGKENYVIIKHADGTFGRYFHLTNNGALVSVGDGITKGQGIGLSGDTGYSVQPHLHFDVTRDCAIPAPNCQTIKIEFMNAEDNVPVAGKSYEALPY